MPNAKKPKEMRPEKKAALEADGWKIGTVQELLDLSDEDSAAIEAAQERGGDGSEEER